jgi:hypothetical protein
MAMVSRRRIVPDGALEPMFMSVGDSVAIDRLVRETNTVWCTAPKGHWDRDEGTGRRRHWVQ